MRKKINKDSAFLITSLRSSPPHVVLKKTPFRGVARVARGLYTVTARFALLKRPVTSRARYENKGPVLGADVQRDGFSHSSDRSRRRRLSSAGRDNTRCRPLAMWSDRRLARPGEFAAGARRAHIDEPSVYAQMARGSVVPQDSGIKGIRRSRRPLVVSDDRRIKMHAASLFLRRRSLLASKFTVCRCCLVL